MRICNIFIIVFLLSNLISCVAISQLNDNSKEAAMRKLKADSEKVMKNDELWKKEIFDKIYLGMSKERFKEQFTDYIFKEDNNTIYFFVPHTQNKSRVTFLNDHIVKYELLGSYYGIPGTSYYYDVTYRLKDTRKELNSPQDKYE